MILYGAGGHAKVIYDCLNSQGIDLTGIFDDSPEVKMFFDKTVTHLYDAQKFYGEKLIISIGLNKSRFNISKRIKHDLGRIAHNTASISNYSTVGQGSMIAAMSTVQSGSKIGDHVIVNSGAIIEHDSIVDDFVHVGPGVVVCGEVKIGCGTMIGANATILPGITIGPWAVIGAGSVVTKNIEKESIVIGNPGRIVG